MDVNIFEFVIQPPVQEVAKRNWFLTKIRYTQLIGNFYGYSALPTDVEHKDFVLAHVSAGVDFMEKKASVLVDDDWF